jgi:hypothetical protein
LPAEDQWKERSINHLPHNHFSKFSYNKTDDYNAQSPRTYGGTGIIIMPSSVPRITDKGEDPLGLGRWTWARIQGKQGHITRFVTAYRPVRSTEGEQTVHSQHLRELRRQGRFDEEPREAFIKDLEKEIEEWKESGDHLVISMDANEDVRSGNIADMFGRIGGMREAILTRHPQFSPPATFDKNRKRTPIDGIWVSQAVEVVRAGYGAFEQDGTCPSGHRFLYIDVTLCSVFGYNPPMVYHANARRFNSKDPGLRRKYIRTVRKLYDRGKIYIMKTELQELKANYASLESIKRKHKELSDARFQIRRRAEKKVRHLKVGGVPWAPFLQALRDDIGLWKRVLRIHKGQTTSWKQVRLFMVKCFAPNATDTTLKEAEANHGKCLTRYLKEKVNAPMWRYNHLKRLAQALADDKDTNRWSEHKNSIQIEKNSSNQS